MYEEDKRKQGKRSIALRSDGNHHGKMSATTTDVVCIINLPLYCNPNQKFILFQIDYVHFENDIQESLFACTITDLLSLDFFFPAVTSEIFFILLSNHFV